MMFWYGNHMSAGGWVLMTVGMLAFWGLLIAGAVMFFRSIGDRPRAGDQLSLACTPERLLAERFARGEIDEPEYNGRLAVLHRPVKS